MDVREKLVELLAVHCDMKDKRCIGCEKGLQEAIECKNGRFGKIADHLISHGVTVKEWIPVTERLPEEGDYALCVLKGFNYGGKIQVCKFVPADKFKDKPYFEHFRNGFPSVTHWMPLPQPPKGE